MLSRSPNFYHTLSWSEYQKVASVPEGATAWTNFPTTPAWHWDDATGIITMDLEIDHDTSLVLASYVLAGHSPDTVLQHEQGHFDLHALVYRDFWNQAPSTGSSSGALDLWNTTLSPRLLALEGEGGAYEQSTQWGVNEKNQTLWNAQFDYLLTRNGGTSADLKSWVNGTTFFINNPDGSTSTIRFAIP
jgi:hypothetical protein